MLMVVFGAGASYDSAPSYHPQSLEAGLVNTNRPPLANDLFANRPLFAEVMARFPECQPVIPYLRHPDADIPVERVLEQLQAEAERYPEGQRQLTAIRYYLHCMIWQCEEQWEKIHKGVTNYKTLVDRIERQRKSSEPVCLVTFNYDRMLEAALPVIDLRIGSLGDYVNSKDYKVIKLHGSVNWGRVIEAPPIKKKLASLRDDQIPAEVIRLSPDLWSAKFITRDYKISHGFPMGRSDGTPLFPALAIPVENKFDFECPDYHLAVLQECIPETTKLLVIGWRATDVPLLDLLGKNLQKDIRAMVISGDVSEAIKVIERLKTAGVRARDIIPTPSAGGFTDFLLSGEVDKFLKS